MKYWELLVRTLQLQSVRYRVHSIAQNVDRVVKGLQFSVALMSGPVFAERILQYCVVDVAPFKFCGSQLLTTPINGYVVSGSGHALDWRGVDVRHRRKFSVKYRDSVIGAVR